MEQNFGTKDADLIANEALRVVIRELVKSHFSKASCLLHVTSSHGKKVQIDDEE